MKSEKRFGEKLKELRVSAKKSMGFMARTLGISTVYYSEVEGMKKKPFSSRVDYDLLANTLNTDKTELIELARIERSKLNLDLFTKTHEIAHLALQFGRLVDEDSLTSEQIQEIKEVLQRGKGCDGN